jgi:hypothetical protein
MIDQQLMLAASNWQNALQQFQNSYRRLIIAAAVWKALLLHALMVERLKGLRNKSPEARQTGAQSPAQTNDNRPHCTNHLRQY